MPTLRPLKSSAGLTLPPPPASSDSPLCLSVTLSTSCFSQHTERARPHPQASCCVLSHVLAVHSSACGPRQAPLAGRPAQQLSVPASPQPLPGCVFAPGDLASGPAELGPQMDVGPFDKEPSKS